MPSNEGALTADEEKQCRDLITATPDYPKAGVTFLSIHPLLCDPVGLSVVCKAFVDRYRSFAATHGASFYVAGLDARGFTVGTAVAHALGVGFCMLRKGGKLPPPVISVQYSLEYGNASIEIPAGLFRGSPGASLVVLDDLVATGGTMAAACTLLQRAGGNVLECGTAVEIRGLGGRELVEKAAPLHALLEYDE